MYRLVLEFKLLTAAVFQDSLALLVRAFVFAAPIFVFLNQRKENQLTAIVAYDLQDVDELLEDVRAWADAEDPWALKWTVFLPFANAIFAE